MNKPVWQCMPVDLGQAYAVSCEYKGKRVVYNTNRITHGDNLKHRQAVVWLIAVISYYIQQMEYINEH